MTVMDFLQSSGQLHLFSFLSQTPLPQGAQILPQVTQKHISLDSSMHIETGFNPEQQGRLLIVQPEFSSRQDTEETMLK